jgi:hypothetical protein
MPDKVDPNAPENGNGNEGKSAWEEAGFESEAAMIETAKEASSLRNKIAESEATLQKERTAKSKTDSEFMRQSNVIGEMRKKLEKLEKQPEKQPEKKVDEPTAKIDEESDDELLESLSDDEETKLLGVLNDPKNVELKKAVAKGGDKAKAEFVRNYREHTPVEETVLALKKRKSDTVQLSSIAKAVKDLFRQQNDEEKNNLAAVPGSGAIPDRLAKTKKQVMVGGVDVGFFAKQQ